MPNDVERGFEFACICSLYKLYSGEAPGVLDGLRHCEPPPVEIGRPDSAKKDILLLIAGFTFPLRTVSIWPVTATAQTPENGCDLAIPFQAESLFPETGSLAALHSALVHPFLRAESCTDTLSSCSGST
ncbi:MAG: hypothetical protein P4K83_00700 [Terracidiphilus sp.]|nr:hypothetical protein [Terracidiphilus sp.]